MVKKHLLSILIIILVILGNCKTSSASDLFKTGRSYVTSGQYEKAVTTLKQYIKDYPGGKHLSRAGLFLGKAYLALGDYERAEEAWQYVINNCPGTLEHHKCRYKIALLKLITGHRQEAFRLFEKLANNPDGPLAPEAAAMLRYLGE